MTFTQTGSNRAQHGQDPAGEPESSNIHEMLRQIRNEITSGAPPRGETQAAPPKRDYEFSFDLLTRTADVIDLLQDRCRTLESEKDRMVDSRTELESAQTSLRQWQEMSTSLKGKLDECARQLAETRTRAEAAEKRADGLAARLESSEQRAAMAEELARGFHDRIVTSFGNAARLQEVLMEISARDAAAAKVG